MGGEITTDDNRVRTLSGNAMADVETEGGNIDLFSTGLLRFGSDVHVELYGPSSLAHEVSGIEIHT